MRSRAESDSSTACSSPFPIVAIAIAAVGLYLWNTGSIPLTDPDEGRYAEISREMIASGDWVIPRLFDVPYLEKPPLLYWLTALSFGVFGLNELAARLVPALMAGAGILAVGLFARRVLHPRAGWLSSLVLATSGLYFILARAVVTDMLFTAGVTCALVQFFVAHRGYVGEWRGYLAFWAFLAVATLAKGPAAVVLCGLIIVIDLAWSRSLGSLCRTSLWLGAPLFLALTLPWFLLVEGRCPGFLSFYLWKEHLQRAAGREHSEPVYWFVPWLLLGFLPWTPFAVAALRSWASAALGPSPRQAALRFLVTWSAVVFVTFSLARGKLVPYILPMFPALALLLGDFLHVSLYQRTVVAGVCIRPKLIAGLATFAVSIYVGAAAAAPLFSDRFSAQPQILLARELMKPGDELALVHSHFPSAAFYMERIPYFVGGRPELNFGNSLIGGSPRLVRDLDELKRRTGHRRVFYLSQTREKYLRELRVKLNEPEILLETPRATLLLVRDPRGPTSPLRRP